MTKQITVELPDGVMMTHPDSMMPDSEPDGLYLRMTPEAAAELIERVKAAKEKAARPSGMPEGGEKYWYINDIGRCEDDLWSDHGNVDGMRLEIGNVFLTEAECLAEIEYRKALQRVRQWKRENLSAGIVPAYDLFDLPIMRGVSLADQLRLIAACEADLRVLAGVE